MNLCIYIYIILTGSRAYDHLTFIIWIRRNYNAISVIWMHKHCVFLSYSLELGNLVQETVLECFFKIVCTDCLSFTGKDYMRTKVKSNVSENAIFQYGDNVMFTLHMLCVFISMVDKFKNFKAG